MSQICLSTLDFSTSFVMSICLFQPIGNAKSAFKFGTHCGRIQFSRFRYTQLEPLYDGHSTCRVSRKFHDIALSKQRLVRAIHSSLSSVAAALRVRCTTSQSTLCPLVNQHPIYIEERLLTNHCKYIYTRLPSVRKQGKNQLLFLSGSS